MTVLLANAHWLLVPIHVVVCLILIAVVLLQTGKGTDWAGAFGGGGTQAAFGPRGVENTLSRLTKIAAVVFMVTSFSLSLHQSKFQRDDRLDLPERGEAKPKPAAAASPSASPIQVEAPLAVPAAETPQAESSPSTTP